jgi:hypothetical protein
MPLTLLTMASCLVGLVYLLDIVNFNATNLEWKTTFRKSKILSWAAPTTNKGAINLFAVGHLTSENLAEPLANYGYEPVYRVNLILEQDVAVALQKENGPLKDESSLFHYPLTSRTATLSAKLKTLRKDAPTLGENDPFHFLFDGRGIGKNHETVLETFPPHLLVMGNILAAEMNICSYSIDNADGTPARMGYTLYLRNIYFLGNDDVSLSLANSLTPPKRQGDDLVSPRKNKLAGQLVVFSDDED